MAPRSAIQLRSSPLTLPDARIRSSVASASSSRVSPRSSRRAMCAAHAGSGQPESFVPGALLPPTSRQRLPLASTATRAGSCHEATASRTSSPSAKHRRAVGSGVATSERGPSRATSSGKPGSCGTPTPPTSSAIDPETKMLGVVGRAIAVLCAALVFAACASAPVAVPSASARGTIALSLAYASVSATQAGAWVAKEQGIFERNGLDVKLESIAGGSSPTAALLSDQVQALQISVEAMSAGVEGGDIVYVAAPVSSPLFWFVALPTVNGPADLKGKKIGATAIGSATYFADVLALQKLGLDPDKDVTLTSLNNVPAILAAMQSGQGAAGAPPSAATPPGKKRRMKTALDVPAPRVPHPPPWP